jgi:small multidrug resistance family-3 protein
MKTVVVYVLAALAEIAGCFSFWSWLWLGKPIWWLIPGGIASLVCFASLLTLVESGAAGRAYAAYGGVYTTASLFWLWAVEGARPDRWDTVGACIALIGAGIIIFGPRS